MVSKNHSFKNRFLSLILSALFLSIYIPTPDFRAEIDSHAKECATGNHVFELCADDFHHWEECIYCGAEGASDFHHIGDPATIYNPEVCTVCGFIIEPILPHEHVFSDEYLFDVFRHWQECVYCHEPTEPVLHAFDNDCDSECAICGYIRDVEHFLNFKVCYDDEFHWNECSKCGEVKELAPHVYDNACDTDCNVCGAIRETKHIPCSDYLLSEAGHSLVCSVCGEVISFVAHSFAYDCDEYCDICGYHRNTTHHYSLDWTFNATSHWHGCLECGAVVNLEDHFPGAAATEETPQLCTICGCVIQPALGHSHQSSLDYHFDEQAHWKTCSGCFETLENAPHIYDDNCDSDCNVCGYVRDVHHQYADELTFNDEGHWYACIICGVTDTVQPHVFDNDCDDGCNLCGFHRMPMHYFDSEWHSNDESHWKECNNCFAHIDNESHSYDSDCDQTCNICGAIRVTTHRFTDNYLFDDTGHWKSCSSCGDVSPIEPHVYDNNCDTTCNLCGYIREVYHPYDSNWHSNLDFHWIECPICHDRKQVSSHVYDNDCDADCNVCGKSRAITHHYANDWSSNESSHWLECTVCGNRTHLAFHTVGPDPTEDTPQVCLDCGYIIQPALKHSHQLVEPYRFDMNSHWKTCDGCSMIFENEAHIFDNDCDPVCNVCGYSREIVHLAKEGVFYDENVHWHECQLCGLRFEEEKHHGGVATCQDLALCEVCGNPYGALNAHQLVFVPRSEPTTVADGNIDYCYCEICNRYFDDIDAENEFSLEQTVLPRLQSSRDITSSVYTIDDTVVTDIVGGTSVLQFLSNIDQREYCRISRGGTYLEDGQIVLTGDSLVLLNEDDDVVSMRIIVVSGDINSDGDVSITDMLLIKAYLLGFQDFTSIEFLAADITSDGELSITDFIQLKAILLGVELL